jgi:hypothetical protein
VVVGSEVGQKLAVVAVGGVRSTTNQDGFFFRLWSETHAEYLLNNLYRVYATTDRKAIGIKKKTKRISHVQVH